MVRQYFFRSSGGSWISDSDISDELLELPGSGWQLITANDTTEHYDATGKLLSISSRNGRTQTLNYDSNDRLVTVSDDAGRALSFTYDSSNRISTLTDPIGRLYHNDYDTNDNFVSITYPDGKTRTYHYNEPTYTSNANLPHALTGMCSVTATMAAARLLPIHWAVSTRISSRPYSA